MSVLESRSPFLDVSSFEAGEAEEAPPSESSAQAYESPFLRSYLTEAEDGSLDPQTQELGVFLCELYDEELDEELLRIAGEASGHYEALTSGENGSLITDSSEASRQVEVRYEPLVREVEAAIDGLADATDNRDLRSLSEAELEQIFASLVPADAARTNGEPSSTGPAFEFLFGIGKVFKKVAGKALDLAKRGVKAVAGLALGPLLRRLKPIAIALLKKAIKAGSKVRPELQPHLARLAQRLATAHETEDASPEGTDATGDVRTLQQEFDVGIADVVFADSETQMELEAQAYVQETDRALAQPDPVAELGRARERLISQLAEADDGDDIGPHIEGFIPAALPLLKLAMRLTGGRTALAKTLTRLIAPLVKRFVGKTAAQPLSRALVEAGLRLMQLEVTPEDERRAAGSAVAAVVEDTVRQVGALPEYVLNDDALLEGFVLEAFEQAAARTLPQILTEETYLARPELRRDLTLRGAWIPLPLHGPKRYRKYTRTPWLTLSPYQAAHLRGFRGLPLASVLYPRIGRPPGAGLRTRVHLYEALPGTSLIDIVRGERDVGGLGGPEGSGEGLLHPLTPQSAGLLLGEPALGEETADSHLSGHPLGVGQRLYYLETPDAVMPAPARGARRAMRPSQAAVTLRFPDNTLVAELYLGESDAQRIAAGLRGGLSAGRVLAPIVPLVKQRLSAALSPYRLRLVHASVTPGRSATALNRLSAATFARLARAVEDGMTRGLGNVLKDHRDAFVRATEARADGVTVRVAMKAPHILPRMRAELAGAPATPSYPDQEADAPDVAVIAGHGPA